MAKLALAILLLLAVAASASAAASLGAGAGDHLDLGFLSGGGGGRRECRGTVAECLAEEEEEELGSASAEGHRRALYGRRYISYGALRRDTVPCSRRGASYYNCRPGAQANPYHRGCSRITRCRG
ncbi:rapid alkalinization factor-like [Phragmites australis]|uniref:rapid alkalinization factor-like n=1 Tax=Phragmites australis TaxID=29695 RepID=UPI002D78421B|nr:rapid alkalinization factor-like [Phragmites australis]